MRLFRITSSRYASDLTGTGGLYGPGRWHQEGTRIVYTAEHVSLAQLEILANTPKLPRNRSLVTLEIPDNASVLSIRADTLPPGWQAILYPGELAEIGQEWIKASQFWVMRVPSAHSPTEFNYLLNPLHPEHSTVRIISTEPHPFDSRLK
ncbi:RES family NAD+ phosphorylase [Tellurirhabdus rosea]|uniref:RES family NAD+ phosphorylase n=1 Tax=Tellurirhabdus rosea TaxID=2674997 RepID=UPI0022567D06|nr:RES family NAD+ phosphorylase [Tellurirhabdus rosea]